MLNLALFVHYAIFAYSILIALRIVASWFPQTMHHPLVRIAGQVTDPYLNVFRRFIPPIGGTLDLSPILAFVGLTMLEKFLITLIM
jgi:YggT family protein